MNEHRRAGKPVAHFPAGTAAFQCLAHRFASASPVPLRVAPGSPLILHIPPSLRGKLEIGQGKTFISPPGFWKVGAFGKSEALIRL